MTKKIIPYFNIYAADLKAFKDKISPQEMFKIFDAMSDICMYGITDFIPENNYQKMYMKKLEENLKKSINNYTASVENGRKGGRPKKPIGYSQDNPEETQTKPRKEKKIKENIKEYNKEKIYKKENFKKPTIQEIIDYCVERNNRVDANRFYDFYTSKGWKVGNQSMKDWKAAIRNWERKQSDNPPTIREALNEWKNSNE